jgi:hypothetical protein
MVVLLHQRLHCKESLRRVAATQVEPLVALEAPVDSEGLNFPEGMAVMDLQPQTLLEVEVVLAARAEQVKMVVTVIQQQQEMMAEVVEVVLVGVVPLLELLGQRWVVRVEILQQVRSAVLVLL